MTTKEAVALLERYSNYDGMGIQNLAGCKEAMRVAVDALKKACPELAESEDERIRKVLVDMVKRETGFTGFPSQGQILAYLEKQKDSVSNAKYIEDVAHAFEDGRKKGIEEEQKPAESISQLTVQGKGVYKICPRCKERMIRDDSMVYTSMPPQYIYECPKCGERECDTVMYDNPEMEEQKPWKVGANAYFTPDEETPIVEKEQKPKNELEDVFKYYTDRGITISFEDIKAEPNKEQKLTEVREVDLEEEIYSWLQGGGLIYPMSSKEKINIKNTARNFYELGLNARKEE